MINFELLRQLFGQYLYGVSPHVSEDHIYAFTMFLYPKISRFVIAELDQALASPDFVRHYNLLMAMSSVRPHTLDSSDLLKFLRDQGDGLILLSPSRRLDDKIWKPDESGPLDRDYVWPLAVNSQSVVKRHGSGRYRRTKADVASWRWATAFIPNDYIGWISDGIVNDDLPVEAVVVDHGGVMVVFQINAKNHGEWATRCKEIRTHLLKEGLPDVAFRIDALIPLQHGTQKHGTIIYFA